MSIWQYSSTEARTRAKQRYNEKHYDQLKIHVAKGARNIVQQLAAAQGVSMAEYIRSLIIRDAAAHGIDVHAELGGGGSTTDRLIDIINAQLCGDWVR